MAQVVPWTCFRKPRMSNAWRTRDTLPSRSAGPKCKLANSMSIDSTVSRPMRKARETHSENRFVPGVLPWLIAGVALLLYTLSLNHWLSLSSLLPVARLSGWIWQPSLTDPLYWLVTYPLRWLPASLIPLLLNLFSAVCAALTLALLARSVSLLPHDRTKEQRIRLTSPDPGYLNTDILGTTRGRCVGVRAATEFLGKRNGRID